MQIIDVLIFFTIMILVILIHNIIVRNKHTKKNINNNIYINNKKNMHNIDNNSNNLLSQKNIYLRNEYIRFHGDSRMAAAEILDRQIELLRKKHPGRTLEWYIEKAIYDLQRDRHSF
jgi:hypothetical protein